VLGYPLHMRADPSSDLVFSPVDHAAGEHVHVYLRDRYIAIINRHPSGGYLVASQHFHGAIVRSEDEAREVVRMWIRSL